MSADDEPDTSIGLVAAAMRLSVVVAAVGSGSCRKLDGPTD